MKITEQQIKHHSHQGLGALIAYENTADGLQGQATGGYFRVVVYSLNIIRVQISEEDSFDELSYAVICNPTAVPFEITETEDSIVIETASTKLKLDKDPMRFSFFNHQGDLLNEDYSGFGVSFLGNSKSVYKTIQKGERFIGLGEKTGNLNRRGSGYTNLNTDSFAYSHESDPLYSTIPFYIGLHHGVSYGIFLDNTYESAFNFGASNDRFSSFTVQGGDLNYYFINGATVAEIISSYTHLTGRMEMPPLWGLGYQQCRYSYYPDDEVYNVAKTFREKKIPADAIVLDIHYMDNYKIFSWDADRFPEPEKLLGTLNDQGFNVVVMCDPGIKIEKGYTPYEEGVDKGLFLKYPDGTNYSGQVWPGWCHFPDFTKEDTREWWADKLKGYTQIGVKGFWNDMNEIATWGQKLPEIIDFDFEGEGGSTKRGRNIYGLMMSKSTFEGVKKHLGDERPFNLTRSAYSGVQRFSAVWTGDNVSSDEHMLLGVRLVNSLGLSGVAYTGYDVGGFVGEASISLFARWISLGAFSPFFRTHSMINSRDSEPWSYGEEVEDISRNYINLRYQLIPYLYSAFYEASVNGLPVCRSLAIDYSFDDEIYHPLYQNQYLFGPSILVAPLESYKEIAKVYLPEGRWFDFHSESLYEGNSHIFVDAPLTHLPLFIKAGSIIPMQSVVQSTQDKPEPVLQLHLYAESNGEFLYFEDDGNTYGYQNGDSYQRTIRYNHEEGTIELAAVNGNWESKFKEIKFFLHGFDGIGFAELADLKLSMEEEEVVFLPAISNFDPLGKEIEKKSVTVVTFSIPNSIEAIKVSLKQGS